ncbi:MAG: hypothetical protein FWG40_11315 [Peptococcaceae bacterium]|nr:hypothetical protein [Peptococcaceae bacterium]
MGKPHTLFEIRAQQAGLRDLEKQRLLAERYGIMGVADDIARNSIKLNDPIKIKTNKGIEVEFKNPVGTIIKWTEQAPKDIDMIIEANLKSGNKGKILEGETAQIVQDAGVLEGTSLKLETPTKMPVGDIDILASSGTNKYIIEVKESVGAIRSSQIDKLTNPLHPNFFNHEGRQIIYYLENPIANGPEQLAKLKLLEEKGVRIISSPEELRGLFQP